MESIKRKVRVTIEREYEIEFTPALFGSMSEEEYLTEFRRALWPVDSMDDVAKYAARTAAFYGGGMQHDGLGLLGEKGCCYPGGKIPDVLFDEIYDDCETEVVHGNE